MTNMSRRQPGEKSGSVAVHIYGGLGNQLFQYACGRALALRRGAAFRIDNRDFSAGTGQLYGLHHFNIVNQSDQTGILPPSRSERLRYVIWRYLKLPPTFIREQGAAFDPDILSLSGDNLLHGYWQSERYFEDCGELIRNELTITTPPSQKNRQILDEIGSLPAVSMHVRRGDYVTNLKALSYHGVCSVEYYRKAAQHMTENMVGEPVFYVFSDDPDWAREHLDLPFETRIIDHNDSEHN